MVRLITTGLTGHVVELGLAAHVGGEEAVVDEPELVGVGVDVHAGDQADAGKHAVGVAAVLATDQFDAPTVVLVEAPGRRTRRSPAR